MVVLLKIIQIQPCLTLSGVRQSLQNCDLRCDFVSDTALEIGCVDSRLCRCDGGVEKPPTKKFLMGATIRRFITMQFCHWGNSRIHFCTGQKLGQTWISVVPTQQFINDTTYALQSGLSSYGMFNAIASGSSINIANIFDFGNVVTWPRKGGRTKVELCWEKERQQNHEKEQIRRRSDHRDPPGGRRRRHAGGHGLCPA